MKVVSNSSPLIILYKCGELDLLKKLFKEVLIPEAVHSETVQNTKDPQQSKTIDQTDFIKIHPVSTEPFSFSHRIDLGEAEAITLAKELQADYLILDDRRAQKEASQQKVTFVPTFALLLKGVQKGFIENLEELLSKLERGNIFLSRELNVEAKKFLNSSS